MIENRKEVINKIENGLTINFNSSEKENNWRWYNIPIITEEKYYNFETVEKLKEHLKQKIDETEFIPKLQEVLGE